MERLGNGTANDILARLRRHAEDVDEEGWGMVYLDNAMPSDISGHQYAGYLAVLQRRGVYRIVDGYAWGQVKMQ